MPKVLVVEDKVKFREPLIEILLSNNDPRYEVEDAASSEEAQKFIREFEPDVVLLDLKIPRTDEEEPEIRNAISVLQEVTLLNYEKNLDSKVIVISGSIDDPGLRRLIEGDRSSIISFINKNEGATITDEFKKNLLKLVKRALNADAPLRSLDYSAIRRSVVRELKDFNVELFEKIDKEVLTEFEKLNDKGTNVYKKSKDVIISCGEIVEDVLAFLKSHNTKLTDIKYSEDSAKVRNRLTSLTGRKAQKVEITDQKGEKKYQIHFKPNGEIDAISRFAAETAFMAYSLRSEAVHGGKEDDERNAKLFANKYQFTREDAAVSVNLIMPLIRDYINYLKTQIKAK